MDGKSHIQFGVSCGAACVLAMPVISQQFPLIHNTPETKALALLGCSFGALIPDIDSYNSTIGKLFYPVSQLMDAVIKIMTFQDLWKHRFIMHSAAYYTALMYYTYNYHTEWLWLIIGCLTHLFLDAFNPEGIPILAPVSKMKIKLGNIKSGGTASTVLTIILMAIVIVIGVRFKVRGCLL